VEAPPRTTGRSNILQAGELSHLESHLPETVNYILMLGVFRQIRHTVRATLPKHDRHYVHACLTRRPATPVPISFSPTARRGNPSKSDAMHVVACGGLQVVHGRVGCVGGGVTVPATNSPEKWPPPDTVGLSQQPPGDRPARPMQLNGLA